MNKKYLKRKSTNKLKKSVSKNKRKSVSKNKRKSVSKNKRKSIRKSVSKKPRNSTKNKIKRYSQKNRRKSLRRRTTSALSNYFGRGERPRQINILEQLYDAADEGNIDNVASILNANQNIQINYTLGNRGIGGVRVTPLYIASCKEHPDIVELIYEYWVNNLPNEEYNNPIKWTDTYGNTPLMAAAYNGCLKVVTYILNLEIGKIIINDTNYGQCTALYFASKKGRTDVVSKLLESGANINTQDVNGVTPLMIASENNHAGVVEVLLESGANINTQDVNGVTPLIIASENNHAGVVEVLLQKMVDDNPQLTRNDNKIEESIQAALYGYCAAVLIAFRKFGLYVETPYWGIEGDWYVVSPAPQQPPAVPPAAQNVPIPTQNPDNSMNTPASTLVGQRYVITPDDS